MFLDTLIGPNPQPPFTIEQIPRCHWCVMNLPVGQGPAGPDESFPGPLALREERYLGQKGEEEEEERGGGVSAGRYVRSDGDAGQRRVHSRAMARITTTGKRRPGTPNVPLPDQLPPDLS